MKLIDIFLQPNHVFASLRSRPQPLLPIAFLILASTSGTALYFDRVDLDWFMEQSILQSDPDISDEQLARIRESAGPGVAVRWAAPLASAFGLGVVFSLLAVYYWIAAKFTSVGLSYKESLALVGWSSMPTLINSILILIGVLGMTPQTPIESLSLTTVDPLLLQLPAGHPWKPLAGSLTFLAVWTTYLGALGWRELSASRTWGTPILIAALPSILVFGVMALRALF
jgi:hypothetical protein